MIKIFIIIIIIMDDFITSSFVYDKNYNKSYGKRFTILNINYEDDEDNEDDNNIEKHKIISNEIIQKKEAFKPNKCYCCIIM